MKSLIVLFSYHHRNTEKVANAIAKVLETQIKNPSDVNPEGLEDYDLIGFGSGIYSAQHHPSLLDLVNKLPPATKGSAFIFSTSAIQGDAKIAKDHAALRERLQSKGYRIVGEFSCKGFNTNSFLRFFGGMNKGRPNTEDLHRAEEFAQNLKKNTPR